MLILTKHYILKNLLPFFLTIIITAALSIGLFSAWHYAQDKVWEEALKYKDAEVNKLELILRERTEEAQKLFIELKRTREESDVRIKELAEQIMQQEVAINSLADGLREEREEMEIELASIVDESSVELVANLPALVENLYQDTSAIFIIQTDDAFVLNRNALVGAKKAMIETLSLRQQTVFLEDTIVVKDSQLMLTREQLIEKDVVIQTFEREVSALKALDVLQADHLKAVLAREEALKQRLNSLQKGGFFKSLKSGFTGVVIGAVAVVVILTQVIK